MSNDLSSPLGCAYLGQYHTEQFRRDLAEIQEAGIGRLYIPMTEEDQELRRPNLETMIQIAGEAGVQVWLIPWGIGGAFSGPAGSRFAARCLDARQIDSAGESLPAACPNQTEFAHFMEEWIDDAVDTGAGGILWNEPQWARHDQLPQYRGLDTARLWACCCGQCQRKFRALYRDPMPEDPDEDVWEFQAQSMAAFLRRLAQRARKRGLSSGLKISPYGAPSAWENLAKSQDMDEFSASAYWAGLAPGQSNHEECLAEFERRAEVILNVLRGLRDLSNCRTFLWLRCFETIAADEPLIPRAARILREKGALDFAIWSFKGTESLGALACERPQEAWQAVLDSLKN